MKKDTDGVSIKPDAGERVDRELSQSLSFLWGSVRAARAGSVHSLYLRLKTGGIWVAVAKRYHPDTQAAQVAFGSGRSVGKALHALSVAMSQGKWKADMPWQGGR